MSFIPYGKQSIDEDDIKAVVEVLKADFLTTGPKIEEFEKALTNYCGSKYAVVVSNGTAALHLASLSLLNPGDKVLTTPNTFLATANSILYANAKPVFIDIKEDGNINLDLCEEALKNDNSIKALYAVHFSGNPVEQEKLERLKNKYGILILEDCAHSLGAEYKGVKAGSCTNSDFSILSFHPVKPITAGEGGAITTNDFKLYEKLKILRNHGMVKEKDMAPWEYEMQELGFNYRITDIQCALALSQLKKLDEFTAKRRKIASRYDKAFKNSDFIKPLYPLNDRSSYHLYVVLVEFDRLNITKEELFKQMRKQGIGLQLHYIPVNKQPYYRKLGFGNEKHPIMQNYYKKAFSLPIYPALTEQNQEYVINKLLETLNV
ncbi:UDP-4-amino-4,6-dideoxy-N-acetyl-beta-L-altrosamine transaminase [Hydrogenimonas thermophila]|uniref:UDP-4-amino-4, 6-dideoxy-N-acetyl-beta-L-altrosamine transaminase n=1 Tax=Hydrogenimonas thermophila TaxID=223786 RepID=UPI002937425D|nr:UDP-4-amino-4,6-dideoxy-N-acetyl-beta-L-altrosamine transaminase [Hydrogenimonas thermophila]WOE69935.1 UDP-4-amino-4,6-dideoxy-N-acetyl-beta-L-altrosamine transaminase [Hydrogenimonas thermophila]WOE72452.1 UDP-4-amino-4,6-dideoxy-N-acetyl-beta-L-altrosamine transaminase [Hydrogenimonas thermophila]